MSLLVLAAALAGLSEDPQPQQTDNASCPQVWNAMIRFADSDTRIVHRIDRLTGLKSEDAARTAILRATGNDFVEHHEINASDASSISGQDCDGDDIVDGYEHIFIDAAPTGFTPGDWAEIREKRSDPFLGQLYAIQQSSQD